MRFLHDDLDADIVRKATGKDSSSNPKAPIYLNAVRAKLPSSSATVRNPHLASTAFPTPFFPLHSILQELPTPILRFSQVQINAAALG